MQSILLNSLASTASASDFHVPSDECHQVVLMLWLVAWFLIQSSVNTPLLIGCQMQSR